VDAIKLTSWVCQGYLTFFFLRSAYRKTVHFSRVAEEFQRWGYPYPGAVTAFLAVVWVIAGISLLIPSLVAAAALLLMLFMFAAFATLLVHGEIRRLVEPGIPIVLLAIIVVLRSDEVMNTLQMIKEWK
jgi:uncharacterized membrane protein YphA (DoxX/SURF4 family)